MSNERNAYLFCDASVLSAHEVGGGCVVVCGSEMAYRSFRIEAATTTEAEIRAAAEGARFALETFTGIEALLITSDCADVSALPFGMLAEGVADEVDPSGILGACRRAGVRHAIRWWPGHSKGADVASYLGNVAHVLAAYGGQGTLLQGAVPFSGGWRSRMAQAVGPERLDQSVPGLSQKEEIAFTGIVPEPESLLPRPMRHRERQMARPLSSAAWIRDEAERSGIATYPPDDPGAAFLERQGPVSGASVYVSTAASDSFIGHALATLRGGRANLRSWRTPVVPGEPFRTLSALHAGRALAGEIREWAEPGLVDVVTADPDLARMIAGDYAPFPEVAEAGATLLGTARDGGLTLRACVGRGVTPPVRGRGLGLDLLTAVSVLRDIALAGYETEASLRSDEVAGYLDTVIERRHALGMALTLRAQKRVTEPVFRHIPGNEAGNAFSEVAERIHQGYRGRMLERPAILPTPGRDGTLFVLSGNRRVPPRREWSIDEESRYAWRDWAWYYADLVRSHPIQELRDQLAVIGGWPGPETWDRGRIEATMAWLDGDDEACPFGLAAPTRPPMRERLLALREAAGAWPFAQHENLDEADEVGPGGP